MFFQKLIKIFTDQNAASGDSSSDVIFLEAQVGRPQQSNSCIAGIKRKLTTLRTLAPKLIPEEQLKLRRSLDQLIDSVIMKQETNVKEERDSGNTSDEDVKPTVSFKNVKVERSTR